MESILEMLPIPGGLGAALKGDKSGAIGQMETFSKKAEAIILSMTPGERRNPKILNGSRRKRIALGSGTHPSDVNELMRRFEQAKKMSKRLFRMQKGLNMFR
jgi:signal recognition particle subunit SRP54